MSEQVFPIQSDLFANLIGQQYDLIVSNPPYVDQQDLDDMPEEYHHEPEIGLGSGFDGLDITRRILQQAADYLTEQGVLVVEVGNSKLQLCQLLPEVEFDWPEFEFGGHGVFVLTKAQLVKYRGLFSQLATVKGESDVG